MTEDEAKSKWCPFSRVLAQTYTQQGEFKVSTGYNYNRSPDDEEGYITPASMCIGSACMAWRWAGAEGETQTLYADEPAPGPGWTVERAPWDADPNKLLSGPQMLQRWSAPATARAGFCGLTGAPA